MIRLIGISKTFESDSGTFEALRDVSLTIEDGDIYGIIGMSGAGKSTLVRCINLLERPTKGRIEIDGVDMLSLSAKELLVKRRSISMIFQGFDLLMQKNCLSNVRFPLELAGVSRRAANARALELLEIVGLSDKAKEYPVHLSGGQQQRVAIARALAADPKVLLCDEATSALDPRTTADTLKLIREIHDRLNITVVVITHQMSVIEAICSKVAVLENGCVAEEGAVNAVFSSPKSAAARALVFPDSYQSYVDSTVSERCIRVVFNGLDTAGQPIIARMAIEEHIEANILFASTKSISGRTYGSMLLGVSDRDDTVNRAIKYLSRYEDIITEEVVKENE